MRVVVRPDPDDQFIKIAINGELAEASNEHQDFEYEVYADDGTPLETGKGRDAYDKALGALRIFNDREILRMAGVKEDLVHRTANLTESYAASGERMNLAVRVQDADVEFAIYDYEIDDPDPETFDWLRDDDPDKTFVI